MRTCKTLFGAGIPHLLESTVYLRSIEKTIQFLHFIFATSFRIERFQNLRSINIGICGAIAPEQCRALAPYMIRMLQSATDLEHLDLALLDQFCEADPNFLNVVASLPSLRKLHIRNSEEKVLDLLSAIRSPLQELDASFDMFDDLPDPLPHLRNISPTLTTLSLRWVYLRLRGIRCNSVRNLTIRAYVPIYATVVVSSFPGLVTLDIETCNKGSRIENADLLRKWNQENLNAAEEWPKLCKLKGAAVELYIMGLSCPVHYLDMHSINASTLEWVQPLLDSHQPHFVRLSLSLGTLVDPGNTFREVLEHLSLSCTHLMLDFYPAQPSADPFLVRQDILFDASFFNLSPLQIALVDCLHGLHITHIKISLSILRTRRMYKGAGVTTNEDRNIDRQESALNPTLEAPTLEARVSDVEDNHPTMQEIESLAGVIAIRMPTLVRIGFDVTHASVISKFWDVCRVSADKGNVQQVYLKETDCSKAQEEMWRVAKAGLEK